MRAGIRKALIENIPRIKDCYEPTVPNKKTIKPYIVIVQGEDADNEGNAIGFRRTINIWLYEKRTTFNKLDELTKEVVEALDFKTITS